MRVDPTTLLFFDASCLIAAAGSPQGGSSFLLSLCRRRLLRGAVSQPVLLEAERNIEAKMGAAALSAFHRLLAITPLILAPIASNRELQAYQPIVNVKDAHVLAAVMTSGAQCLLTLDRELVSQVNQSDLPVVALTPGAFIRQHLPDHPDYPPKSGA